MALAFVNLSNKYVGKVNDKNVIDKFPPAGVNLLDKWSYMEKVNDKSFMRKLQLNGSSSSPGEAPQRHPRKVYYKS